MIQAVQGKHLSIYSKVQMFIGRCPVKLLSSNIIKVYDIIIRALSMVISVLLDISIVSNNW